MLEVDLAVRAGDLIAVGIDPFKPRGLDGYFNGTLNIDIRPYTFKLFKPEYTFLNVEWTDLHPPEHFSFSRCKVIFRDIEL